MIIKKRDRNDCKIGGREAEQKFKEALKKDADALNKHFKNKVKSSEEDIER